MHTGGTVIVQRDGAAVLEVSEGRVTLVDEPGFAYDYDVEVGADESAASLRMVCKSLTVRARDGGPPVTSRGLMGEVGKAKWEAVARLSWPIDDEPTPLGTRPNADDVRVVMHGGSRGRPSTPRKELQQAATLYLEALAEGRPTTVAVARGLTVSPSTARKRVMAARRAGLIPPAESTRPRA